LARKRPQRQRGVTGVFDVQAGSCERGGACHDDEDPDDPCEQRSDHDLDPFRPVFARRYALVHRVGLDEREAPWRKRRSYRRGYGHDRSGGQGHAGYHQPARGLGPVGLSEHSGHDVCGKYGRDSEQDVFDAVKRFRQHQCDDEAGGPQHARCLRQAGELCNGSDAGELGADRTEVGQHEQRAGRLGCRVAVACSDNGDEAFAAADRKADGQQVKENKQRCGDHDDPQELVAEIGAQDRVGRDARGIVVGKSGEHARSDYGDQGRQARAPAAPVVRKTSRDSSPLVADLWLKITHC
jgi:hypothetical protein